MSARHQLQELLTHPHIWRGGQASRAHAQVLSSGDAQLDHALAGGWPLGSLCELLTEQWGLGEFRLLLPALSRLTAETNKAVARQVMLVNPPYIPYAPALLAAGVDISRVLVTRCADSQDLFWAMEQALRSRTCAAVLGWCEAADDQCLRRLQLAAEAAGSWAVLLRPGGFRRQRSPASLRLHVSPSSAAGLDVAIIKQRGGRPKRLVLKA
jgi:cell division inhibitor SulA/protein ImuA